MTYDDIEQVNTSMIICINRDGNQSEIEWLLNINKIIVAKSITKACLKRIMKASHFNYFISSVRFIYKLIGIGIYRMGNTILKLYLAMASAHK